MASGIELLESFIIHQHKVDQEIFALLKQDGVESLADFVGLFTDRDYEDGLKDYAERSANHKGSKIQLSRLGIAWMVAKRELQSAKPLEDGDLEAPLGSEITKRQEAEFRTKYGGLQLPPEISPAPALFNRLYREFRKQQQKSVEELSRVRSFADANQAAPHQIMKNMGDFRVVLKTESPETNFRDTMSLLKAHEVLCMAWAMTGTCAHESKMHPGTQCAFQSTRCSDITSP